MEKKCTRCGSVNLVETGATKTGIKLYKCMDCKYRSSMRQILNYTKAVYEDLYKETSKLADLRREKEILSLLSEDERRVISLYKFSMGVSELDLAAHLHKPLHVIHDYVSLCEKRMSKDKKVISPPRNSKKIKHWLGVK